MFLLNKTKGNTIFYTHLFIKKFMYGHFTFFFNYYFKGTGQTKKMVEKKSRKEPQKKVIKTKKPKRHECAQISNREETKNVSKE